MIWTRTVSESGQPAQIILPADSYDAYNILQIYFSYNGLLLTPGTLSIQIDETIIMSIDIRTPNWGVIEAPIFTDFNQSVTVTLSGMYGLISKLNVAYS